jgi:nucleoid-associated protein YgaU
MGYQLKIILTVLMVLIVAGLAGVGIRYATKQPGDTEVAENKQDKESAAQSSDTGKGEDRVEGAGDEASAGGETAVAKTIEPSFDIVRVEPTGDVVAAGRASAGARVELLLGDKVVASAVANSSGEWALVFDDPLSPGSYDFVLRATSPDGGGSTIEGDRVTVVIEKPDETPLVAVTRPGEPTEVLQTPGTSGETAVAAASETKGGDAESTPGSAAADGEQASGTAATSAAGQPSSGDVAGEKAAGDQQVAAAGPEAGQATDEPETQADQSAPDTTGQEAAQKLAAPQEPAAVEGGETDASASASPEATVAIETVEVENSNRLMLGGLADAGEAVRIYLNNEPLGDVVTGADGRWTLSTDHPMTPGRYEVRADVVDGDGAVKGRAEVRFDRVQMVEAGQETAGQQTAGSSAAGSSGQGSEVTIVSRTAGSGGASSGGAVGEGAGTSVVVIARGDNLWSIARKIYGKGVRHTVIFEANKNQIGNPHLIYPGQVFTIPVLEDDDNPNG